MIWKEVPELSKEYPLMLIAYDSRVDKISKLTNMFHLLHPSGTTPEGLCFEAVMKEIEPSSKDKDCLLYTSPSPRD